MVSRHDYKRRAFSKLREQFLERKDAGVQAARPVFGVPIQEAVEIARVREDSDLPAVVFRCVQYLSSVKAEEEEGIYRLSGSSAVIKALKDRFNAGKLITCDQVCGRLLIRIADRGRC